MIAGVLNEAEKEAILNCDNNQLVPIVLNVTKHDDCINAVEFVKQESMILNLPFVSLVNNAGVLFSDPIEFIPLERARYMFDTNFWGATDLIKCALPLLRESRGRIVNMSSFTGIAGDLYWSLSKVLILSFCTGPPLGGMYAASKGAVEMMSDSLRREVAHFNVSVSVIQPCYVATNLMMAASAGTAKQGENAESNYAKRQLYYPFYSNFVENLISFCLRVAASADEPTWCIEV